jgi:hypothetical protein
MSLNFSCAISDAAKKWKNSALSGKNQLVRFIQKFRHLESETGVQKMILAVKHL